MSEQNVEAVHRMIEAWNDRDEETIFSLAAPDAEYVNAPAAVEPGTRRGREEIVGVFRKQWDLLGDARQEIERVHDRGEEIFTEQRVSRGMPGSDAHVENKLLLAWRFRDGLVVRLAVLGGGSDFDEALKAAGLPDQPRRD